MKIGRILLALLLVVGSAGLATPAAAAGHRVTYDKYSLMLDGRRILVQAAEFHYFRLPSPDLWRDILEKEKAAGFNAISVFRLRQCRDGVGSVGRGHHRARTR